jgi:DNA repair photolyase
MTTEGITTYWGELLVSPMPLEISGNWCSHNCYYCFANLNKPDRTFDSKATLRLLGSYYERESLEARLLRDGYGVVVSNKVDPFATSNFQQLLPIMEIMTELDIPIAFQTKGGKGIDEALEFVKPSAWYVSIAFWDDKLRQKIEPGAPTIQSRIDLIHKLTEAGHTVTVGVNPWVPEWLPLDDAAKLLDAIANAGAWGVWTEELHLNFKQVANIPERGQDAISAPILQRAQKRKPERTMRNTWLEFRQMVKDWGLELFSVGQRDRSDYFEPFKRLYPHTFPTLQEFINYCHDSRLGINDLIPFERFADFMLPGLPTGRLCIGHYVGSVAHTVCRSYEKWDNWMTYRDLLKMFWADPRIKSCPVRSHPFAYAAVREDGELKQLNDRNGLPYVVFNPDGFSQYYQEVVI